MARKAASRLKTRYVCAACGSVQLRWSGRCPECGEWNTLVEEVVEDRPSLSSAALPSTSKPQPLAEIRADALQRWPLPLGEFSRVLGGGIVPGSLVLIGGDPGIGKSTLLLQTAVLAAQHIGTALYVSGEESAQQIKMRAERLGFGSSDLLLLTETNLDAVIQVIESVQPRVCVVDSIQTMYVDALESSPGTVTQVRECAQRLQTVAKARNIAIFIVGHVTKEGTLAGPKVLEHIVDTVLQLEGDRFHAFRILRSLKNRFGATSEVGVFEMTGEGMREVTNPSEAFLAERVAHVPGSTVAVTMEGTRPLLVEVQALTSPTQAPLPRRTANGFDYNRLFLLLAVLSARLRFNLNARDVFVNIVGGLTIEEPAADLAAAVAIASAYLGKPVPPEVALIGEVGLSGEVRSVSQISQRLHEAAKLGFSRCVIPKTARKVESPPAGMRVLPVRSVGEALDMVLNGAPQQ
ncbi:MAG: DNA repair protein RadA [Thermoflexales bacterium]|nr:DNA repair protein RadA [Thermoflexales bacterium]MCS7324924.1 DNA repair protein RadA [Thermoflexales bacterium]MCX7940007.1 DNA repair protein RadA [Thermoflexales bacterium]MDW8054315.1 DNA repair protein RadA [Anaerolineae bacterium]MDW8291523.1 DNA repair protein RadA [Anaerolineae bacterium]